MFFLVFFVFPYVGTNTVWDHVPAGIAGVMRKLQEGSRECRPNLVPFAARLAMTIAAHDLKSPPVIEVAFKMLPPTTKAVLPSSRIFAPILCNSPTCCILFSKTVSSIFEVPFTVVISAIKGACKSVGNPGNGLVLISTA